MCQEGNDPTKFRQERLEKKLKKPLDKLHKVWYNEYVKRGTHRDTPLRIGGNGNTCELTPRPIDQVCSQSVQNERQNGAVSKGQVRTDTNPKTARGLLYNEKSPEFFQKTS